MTDYEKPYEVLGIRKDGSTFPVEIIGKATTYKGRKVRVGSVQDITERKRVEESLRESEERFRSLYENSTIGIYRTTPDGKIVLANPALVKMLGYSSFEELSLRNLKNEGYKPTYSRTQFLELIERDSVVKGLESAWIRNDGTTFYVRESARAIRDKRGTTLYYDGTVEDITERKQAEVSLQESEEKYRAIIETTSEWIWEIDVHGKHTFSNQGIESVLGYTVSEFLGTNAFNFMETVDQEKVKRKLPDLITSKEGWRNWVIRWYHKNGTLRYLESNANPILDSDGNLLGFRGADRDITDRIKAEESLRQSEEKFRSLAENTSDWIWEVDIDGRYTYSNPKVHDILGYKIEEVIGKTPFEFIKPDNAARITEQFKQAVSTGQPFSDLENVNIHKDGHEVVIETSGTPVFDAEQKLIGYRGIDRDITQRKLAVKTLQESEERFRKIFEEGQLGITIAGPDFKFINVNPAFCRMIGYTNEELSTRTFADITPKDRVSIDRENVLALQRNEIQQYRTEKQYLKKNGELFWGSLHTSILRDNEGNVIHYFAMVEDITERKQAEELLRVRMELMEFAVTHSLEELLQKTLDEVGRLTNSPIGFYHFVEADQKTLSLQAWSTRTVQEFCKAEGKGMHYNIDEAGVWVDCVRELRPIIHNDYASLPHRKGMPEGHAKVIRELVVPILRGDRIVAILGVGNKPSDYVQKDIELISYLADVAWEITQRKQTEEALKESEEKFRSLAEQSPNMIFINKKGRVVYANAKCEEIIEFTKEEFYAPDFDFLKITCPEYIDIVKEKYIKHQQGEEVPPYEYALITKHGKRINAIIATKLIDYEHEKAILGVITDITDRKQMEEEKEKLQSELLQVQKMDAIGQLAGGIAHDFNNMIGVILGYAVLIEKQMDSSNPLHPKVKAIITAAERSANMIKQLLGFARKQIASPIVLKLNDELSTLQKMLNRLIGEDIDLRIVPGKNLWSTKIDPVQIDQILTNLATNARDAIENVGTITIETSNVTFDPSFSGKNPEIVPGEYVMLVFSDTGKGMDRTTQEHIFEPFYTTKPKGKGVGLGLATVFGIVKQNNGYINVYSELDKGTTFKIYLPRHYGEAEAPLTTQEELSLVGIETILVVEDEEQLLNLTVTSLKTYGYTVLGAKSPREAISLCQQTDQKIDLLITDVIMPEMNGKELKEQLDALKPGMKAIFMSGYTANIVAHRGILEEGLHFLQKPFAPFTLAKKVRDVLNG